MASQPKRDGSLPAASKATRRAPQPAETQAQADATIRAMFARDRASQALGMRLVEVGAGRAVVAMTVRPEMIQGHGTCHGGFVFALADSAFAFACNSHGYTAVAAGCHIEYLEPVFEADELTAEAVEEVIAGRSGVCRITVGNQHGKTVAALQCRRDA